MTAGDVAALTGGRLTGTSSATMVSGPVVIDSRLCTPGSLFVALAGEHTDGHDHVGDAVRRGAVAALTSRPADGPTIEVDDVVRALGFLAGGLLRRTTRCRVVGITGSSGKTSTKDLTAAVLSAGDEPAATVAAAGSLNNEIGLPLTVLGIDAATRHLVLEYSARGIGHIAYLTGLARPAVSVVLNVGTAHLGEFGSRQAVATAKGELVEALAPDGLAVLGIDDPLVAAMRSRTAACVLGFGVGPHADVRVAGLRLDEQARARFRLETSAGSADVALHLTGRHQALNAAAAAAVGLAEGRSLAEVVDALEQVTALSAHRMQVQVRADGLTVIDDAYNANPESMAAALEALASLAAGRAGTSWAVLGEMRELGEESAELHAEVGRQAARLGIEHLVVVDGAAAAIARGARSVDGWHGACEVVANATDAAGLVAAAARPDDVVLVKASNAAAFWRVAEMVLANDRSNGEPAELRA